MRNWILIVGFLMVVVGCRHQEYKFMEGKIYGTYYSISYESVLNYDTVIIKEMERVNYSLSMFNPHSVIAKVNREESDQVDSLFVRMFIQARKVYDATEGAFDITVAPLSNAWGFGFKNERLPSAEKVDSLLQYIGMNKLTLNGMQLIKAIEGVQLDASSIAKGLGVDLVADFLDKKGVKNYMVDIGGEIRVRGISSKKRAWRIGIDKPVDDVSASTRELQAVVAIEGGALATSGNYRNFYVVDGKKYAHTINPKTGYPVQRDILSSSVYAPTCMEADAYATAFMVLGKEKAQKIIEEDTKLEACFVYLDDRGKQEVWMSDGFKKLIVSE
ncbi:FAD:protein FMN transferase [Gabonibacter chumensis]|uniref:FAD:protein FMN transferase n=1 Tax=Gabonibacter chumensis TaxID=2972474 RepID=UPI0025745C90|nr:FAD:protein FMN transferase [Gabonibacter chumensis]MCR9012183.1 FAD:protein FMN transferase [Gabonibacter chumensis]